MMPGESPSAATPAGIAAEAATACANCGALQQNLNEYVAALVALKQKIIDTDHLLTEYQQKCNELQFAERENNALRHQVEQMLQKISPLEKCQEELGSVKAELEEKKRSLKIYQETHLEYVRVKEEMNKNDTLKKKLEMKVKKLEEAAAKHTQEFKQLKAEKKVLEKELKKAQEKIDGAPSTRQKKVLKNVETQSERESPVSNLDKEKIKLLLEELWMCIDSSTGKSLFNKNNYSLSGPKHCTFKETVQNHQKSRKPQGGTPSHSSTEICAAQIPLTSLQKKLDDGHTTYDPTIESKTMETSDAYIGNNTFYEGSALDVIAQTELPARNMDVFNREQEELSENLRDVLKWVRPLPPLLSPIQFSPTATPDTIFGHLTDSSDEEMDQDAQILENILENSDLHEPTSVSLDKQHLEECGNKGDSFSVNSDSQELPLKLHKLMNEESLLCSHPVSATSRYLSERDANSNEEENTDFMEIHIATEIAAHKMGNLSEETISMTKTEDRILMPDLTSSPIKLEKEEEEAEPMLVQKVTGNINEHVLSEEMEDFTETIEGDWAQGPIGDDQLKIEDSSLVAKDGIVTVQKIAERCSDGGSRGKGGVANYTKDNQQNSNVEKAMDNPKHLELVTTEKQNTASTILCMDRNGDLLMKEKVDSSNYKLLPKTKHVNEQIQQQGAEKALEQAVEKDACPKPQFAEGENSCSRDTQNEPESNEEHTAVTIGALRTTHLHATVAADWCRSSSYHTDEIIQTEREVTAAPSFPVKGGDGPLKTKNENIGSQVANSITETLESTDVKKEKCIQIEQIDSFKLLQEEPGNGSDPVLSTQAVVTQKCLPLVEMNDMLESENATAGVSEQEHLEDMDVDLKDKSQTHSSSKTFHSLEAITEDECLASKSYVATEGKLAKITGVGIVQSDTTEVSKKASAFETICDGDAQSGLISRHLQDDGEETFSQEKMNWIGKNNSSCLKFALEKPEMNYESSLENENQSEDPPQSIENILQAENADVDKVMTVDSKSAKETTDVTTFDPRTIFFSTNDQKVCIVKTPSFITLCSDSLVKESIDHDDHGKELPTQEASTVDYEEIECRPPNCCNPNNKNEVNIEIAREQSTDTELHISYSGEVSESLASETSNLNVNTDIFAAGKSILNAEKLSMPHAKNDRNLSKRSTVEDNPEEVKTEEISEILSNDVTFGVSNETKMLEDTTAVMNSSVSDSSEDDVFPLRKVNFTKTHFALSPSELDNVSKLGADGSSCTILSDDWHKLCHTEETSPKDCPAEIHDEGIERMREHSYAAARKLNEDACLEPKAFPAMEMSREKQADQSISEAADERNSASGKPSANDLEDNSDIVAANIQDWETVVENSEFLSESYEEKLSPKQKRDKITSGNNSNAFQSHVNDGINTCHNSEEGVNKEEKMLASQTSLISLPSVMELSSSNQEVLSLKSLGFASCTNSGTEQSLKAPGVLNVPAQTQVAGDHGGLLQKIPSCKGKRKSRHALLAEAIYADAGISTPTKHSPKTLSKIRQEMGPPLPPLLPPLIATPPRAVRPLSPLLSSSSRSSLPSPVDGLVSPSHETSAPPVTLSQSDTLKGRPSVTFTTPSPSDMSVGQRILSSPLQFCSATPKHALPVPGRFPSSAGGVAAPLRSQENSVKILDSMYPELSARARTLNILKGNIQLSRSSSLDGKSIPQTVCQISGFKTITSTSTAFIKTGTGFKSDTEQLFSSVSETEKRALAPVAMPKNSKRPRLDDTSSKANFCKEEPSPRASDAGAWCSANVAVCLSSGDATRSAGDCDSELLLAVEKTVEPGNRDVIVALEKIAKSCFDLLPVIHSYVVVGNTSKVPVMTDEEKDVVYEFGVTKKDLAEPALQAILNKLKKRKVSLSHNHIQSLCRVYVGICRQLGELEKARLFCYSLLKEDFPRSAELTLFIGNMWGEIFSSESIISRAIQLVTRQRAKEEVLKCLRCHLNWEESTPVDIGMMITSLLLAIELCPQMEFQLSDQYGEDLKESTWEYVFAIDLLCSHQKWCWTHDNVISKELWPIMDKWIKTRKGNGSVSSHSDAIVGTVLRLIGRLGQIGLREGYFSAVQNISSVIGIFLQHAREKDIAWGVQLAAAYALCDLGPSNPSKVLEAIKAWEAVNTNSLPPGLNSSIAEVRSLLKCAGRTEGC